MPCELTLPSTSWREEGQARVGMASLCALCPPPQMSSLSLDLLDEMQPKVLPPSFFQISLGSAIFPGCWVNGAKLGSETEAVGPQGQQMSWLQGSPQPTHWKDRCDRNQGIARGGGVSGVCTPVVKPGSWRAQPQLLSRRGQDILQSHQSQQTQNTSQRAASRTFQKVRLMNIINLKKSILSYHNLQYQISVKRPL